MEKLANVKATQQSKEGHGGWCKVREGKRDEDGEVCGWDLIA